MAFKLLNNIDSCIAKENVPSLGTCGGCGDSSYHPLEDICTDCATDLGLHCDPFTYYTYPSELMFHSPDIALKRRYFVKGIMY